MSQTHGLIIDSGYQVRIAAPRPVVERVFPIWSVVIVVLATVAAFAPSFAVTMVADLRDASPAACADGGADGVASAAAARRVATDAAAAGRGFGAEGAC